MICYATMRDKKTDSYFTYKLERRGVLIISV